MIYSHVEVMAMPSMGLLPQRLAGKRTCVVIGNFDGVHRGHQALFKKAVKTGFPVIAITFDPHPKEVLSGMAPCRLLDNDTRDALLKQAGADEVVLLAFSMDFARMSPEDFVAKILLDKLCMDTLVCGYDFNLGKGGTGNGVALSKLGATMGFTVTQLAAVLDSDGMIISSTAVRNAVQAGNMSKAALMLGRPFSLDGTVVHGQHRGTDLGFPTANLAIPTYVQIPAPGVYATTAHFLGRSYPAVTNVGDNPTFANAHVTIETHIPSFHGDLYGKELRIDFLDKIREERRFASIESLKIQLASDIRRALGLHRTFMTV